MNNIVAIIPARGGSKGIENKNIYPLLNKPLLAYTIEQSLASSLINHTFVTTNDPKIAAIASHYKAEIIPRPEEISTDKSTTVEAILHAIKYLKEEKQLDPVIIVLLQPTSPLRKADDIDNAIKAFINNSYDSLFSATTLDDLTIWEKNGDQLRSVNFDYKNRTGRQDRAPQLIENGSIYIVKAESVMNSKNITCGKIGVYNMEFWQTWELDTLDEVDVIEHFLLKNRYKLQSERVPEIHNIELIAFDFDGVFTNNKAILFDNGHEGVIINRADGLGISKLKELKIPMLIITTETNPVVKYRSEKLNIELISAATNKKESLLKYAQSRKIDLSKIIYVGNDINDLEVMSIVGYPCCPSDAHPSVKNISKIILQSKGGEGIARELYDLIIR